jgi:glutathione peroxidase
MQTIEAFQKLSTVIPDSDPHNRCVMNLYEISITTIDGQIQTMETYRSQVLLIVNVASKCGFSSQYAGLEALYRRYRHKGFTILGFPCDQFAHQVPGSEKEYITFARLL